MAVLTSLRCSKESEVGSSPKKGGTKKGGTGGNGGQPESVSEIDGAAPKKALCPELKLLMMIV
jgi:hypothetical protein